MVSAKIDRKGINSLFDELLDEYIKKNPNSNSQLSSFQLNPPSNKKIKKKKIVVKFLKIILFKKYK